MTAALAWVLALGGMVALAWGNSIPGWTSGLAALCSLLSIAYAWLLVSQRISPPPRERLPGLLAIALAPVTWLAAASGGAGSPAIVALALGTRAIAGTEDLRTAISVALGALIAITAIDMSLGNTV